MLDRYLARIDLVPSGPDLERWQRRRSKTRRLRRAAILVAGVASTLTPSFLEWSRQHPIGLGAAAASLVIAALLPHALVYFWRKVPHESRLSPSAERTLREASERLRRARPGARLCVGDIDGAARLDGKYIFVDRLVLSIVTPAELDALVARELGHGPTRHRWALDIALLLSWLAITIAVLALVWPSVAAWIVAIAALFLAFFACAVVAPSVEAEQWEEHLADLVASRHAGGWASIGALLKCTDTSRARLDVSIASMQQRLHGERLPVPNDPMRKELSRLKGWREAFFVSWREFDANGDGQIQAGELQTLVASLAPSPSLHLDAFPVSAEDSHPTTLDRILFLIRECPDVRAPLESLRDLRGRSRSA